ncbi:MAG: cytochrome c maturation protein CcmE [Anaerolineae bacterium]
MSQAAWTKGSDPVPQARKSVKRDKIKFVVAGAVILAAVVFLIISGTASGAQYFLTVDELLSDPSYVGKPIRISGAVDGDTIAYDGQNLIIDFEIANIPTETTDLARTLHEAVTDPSAARLQVHVENQVKPDLLENEAQAILTGTLGPDGVFTATEVLLKCPSRYGEAVPEQAGA